MSVFVGRNFKGSFVCHPFINQIKLFLTPKKYSLLVFRLNQLKFLMGLGWRPASFSFLSFGRARIFGSVNFKLGLLFDNRHLKIQSAAKLLLSSLFRKFGLVVCKLTVQQLYLLVCFFFIANPNSIGLT